MAVKILQILVFHWLAALINQPIAVLATGWNYAKESSIGPAHWQDEYPDCLGVMQSPIDIDNSLVLYDPELHYFDLSDYEKTAGVQMSLKNVGGHTAEVIYSGSPINIRGGNLPDEYQMDQFHFHWGKEDSRGSEHAVDGQHLPMEMHIVHHQVHLGNLSVAGSHPYGLAVLGFFFQVIPENNPNLEPLLNHFSQISKAGDKVDITNFKLSDLVSSIQDLDFYRYMGSLTTPPCSETVIWSLATQPLNISEDQLNKFRNLYDSESAPLVDDFRPIQERHARTVTSTVKKAAGGGAQYLQMSLVVLLLACAFSVGVGFLWVDLQ